MSLKLKIVFKDELMVSLNESLTKYKEDLESKKSELSEIIPKLKKKKKNC